MFCFAASAQIQFGYMSYKQILQQLPEYAQATKDLAILKAKYEAEAQKGEEEFQRKFVDFLQGQKDFVRRWLFTPMLGVMHCFQSSH